MLSINTNLSSLIAQNSMSSATKLLNQAVERMTTGYKINHAKDNAANYSIASDMSSKISSYMVAQDNVAMGMDLVTTASDTVSLMQDYATRLHSLSIQARNGTYGAQSLEAIKSEANAITAEIARIYQSTEYNGISLFNGGGITTASETPAIATFAMRSSAPVEETPEITTFATPRATSTENYFISDPISYTKEEVEAMTTITEAIDAGSLVSGGKYSISTVDELVALADYVNSGNDTTGMIFVLGANIDLSSISNWTPIGDYSTNSSYQFKGTFDGNGHVIKNLTIDNETKDYQGLFGRAFNATIKNVGLEGGSVKGKGYVGGLLGSGAIGNVTNCYATMDVTSDGSSVGGLIGGGSNTVSNSYATGNVKGSSSVGGLAGSANRVDNCYATGDVTGDGHSVGGLVGSLASGTTFIKNSYATGNVKGSSSVGGLAGSGNASNCYATGNVTGTSTSSFSRVGGLIGYQVGNVNNCYAIGDVTSNGGEVGGLVGYLANAGYSITNSYATGNVKGSRNVGGLGGDIFLPVTNCYATGNATGSNSGGLIGSASNTVSNSAAVQADSKATQMTEEEIKALYTPEYMGFTEANGWTIVNGTPIQSWQLTKYSGAPDTESGGSDGSGGGTGVASFTLQIGINADSSCQIGFDTTFEYDLSEVEIDIASDEALAQITSFINLLSQKSTELGAVQNRLDSALESIGVNIENLTSSLSTIRDADIAEVSSEYIRQQILQQASATLLSTANQSPSIALQLI